MNTNPSLAISQEAITEDIYTQWFKYPHSEGYWWRSLHNKRCNPCIVQFKEHINETEVPVFYGYFMELGDIHKQPLFEADIPNVSWQKIKDFTHPIASPIE
jgi:hypothetical protein